MFRFASPEYLYLLLVIPVLLIVWGLGVRRQRRRRAAVADAALWTQNTGGASAARQTLKVGVMLLAWVCLVFMLARPQYGVATTQEEKKGIEVVFSVDVSNSMLAQDVQPDRLSRAKLLLSTLVDRMQNDKVALTVFAGEAYPQMPMTEDYAAAKLFLDNMTAGMVTLQGTNLSAAIELGVSSFSENKEVGKALVIITDGEDHEEGALQAAQEAAKKGIQIFVLGIGTTEGARIPLDDGSLLTDGSGQVVQSALNEKMCREVAAAGKGLYLHVDNTNTAGQQLQTSLSQLKQAGHTVSFSHPDEQFQAWGLLALVLLVVECFILEKKNPLWNFIRIFKK